MARRPATPDVPPERRQRGFEPASALLRQRIRAAGEKRGFAASRLLTHWAEIAGEAMAAASHPVKVHYGRDGMGATLTLLVASAHAPMVQMELPRLIERVNAAYGYAAISRISLTQTAASGFAEGQNPFTAAAKPPAQTDPAVHAKAAAVASPVRDQSLRSALETLGQNILSRRKTAEDSPGGT